MSSLNVEMPPCPYRECTVDCRSYITGTNRTSIIEYVAYVGFGREFRRRTDSSCELPIGLSDQTAEKECNECQRSIHF